MSLESSSRVFDTSLLCNSCTVQHLNGISKNPEGARNNEKMGQHDRIRTMMDIYPIPPFAVETRVRLSPDKKGIAYVQKPTIIDRRCSIVQ
jgi:hypothetical protein